MNFKLKEESLRGEEDITFSFDIYLRIANVGLTFLVLLLHVSLINLIDIHFTWTFILGLFSGWSFLLRWSLFLWCLLSRVSSGSWSLRLRLVHAVE